MSCKDSIARWKSVTNATPYSLSKPEISSVANPDPGFGIWDPGSGSGIGKKSGSRFVIRIRDGKLGSYFWEQRNHFFLLKYLNSLMRIQDPGSEMENIQIWDQGSRMEKIWIRDWKHSDPGLRIRDKHPRSAKLEISSPNLLGLKEPNNNRTLCGKAFWDETGFFNLH